MPPAARDRGDVVLGWLVKLVLALGVVGVLAFDGLSIVTTSLTLEDQAVSAAREGTDVLERTPTVEAAFDAALASALASDGLNELAPDDVHVTPDGTVTLTLRRTAPTLVLHYTRWSRAWADRSATAGAAPMR